MLLLKEVLIKCGNIGKNIACELLYLYITDTDHEQNCMSIKIRWKSRQTFLCPSFSVICFQNGKITSFNIIITQCLLSAPHITGILRIIW